MKLQIQHLLVIWLVDVFIPLITLQLDFHRAASMTLDDDVPVLVNEGLNVLDALILRSDVLVGSGAPRLYSGSLVSSSLSDSRLSSLYAILKNFDVFVACLIKEI